MENVHPTKRPQLLESRLKYVAMRASGEDDAYFKDAGWWPLKKKLQEYPVSINEATRINDLLMCAPIAMAARDECIDLMDQKQSRPKNGGSEGT